MRKVLSRLLRWIALSVLFAAIALGGVIAFNIGYPKLIVALSRPAAASDLQQIAVAVLRQTDAPLYQDEPQLMYVTVDGTDLPGGLLKSVSHGRIIAVPGNLAGKPPPQAFTAEVGPFLISPSGEASGMVYTSCSSICGQGVRFVLRKQDGRWIVVSKTRETIA